MTRDQYRALIIKRADFLHRIRQVTDLGGNSIFAPSNSQYISVEKMSPFSGGYYLKVKNKNTGQDVKFGKLSIDNIFKKQRAVDEYNQLESASLPSIIENPLYYITNNHLKLTNFRTSMYSDLTMSFFKARSARTKQEVEELDLVGQAVHGEATFSKNEQSQIFAHAGARHYRLIIAKLASIR